MVRERIITQANDRLCEMTGWSREELLNQGQPGQFDLVITDMTMPKLNGDRLTREILDIRQDMPVILCTGYSERISEGSAGDIGLAKYLEKPLDRLTLAASVREVLDNWR